MTTAIKRRRGTTSQHSTFTGLDGEITVDSTKKTLVVHDGATAGGFPLPTLTGSETLTNKALNGTLGATTPSTVAATTITTSGNVGIGTGSPARKLHVSGADTVLRLQSSTAGVYTEFTNSGGSAYIGSISGSNIYFETGGAEKMRLDSSGNLGLGVTPSANAGSRTLSIANQTGGFSALTMGSNFTQAGYIGYNMGNTGTNSTWKYISADTGSALWFNGNEFRFMQFASGSAGATTSGTQAMTLDASGNLGVGTTASAWQGNFKAIELGYAGSGLSTNVSGKVILASNYYFNGGNKFAATGYGGIYQQADGVHYWGASTASGTAGGAMTLTTGMILDVTGNLLVGTTTTTSGARFSLVSSNNTTATYNSLFKNSSGTILFAMDDGGSFYTGLAAASPFNATTASGANVVIVSTGQLQRSTSSLKYKKDIENSSHGLAEVLKLRSVTYKGKNDGDTVFGGLIAEEVDEAGLTEFVTYTEDGSPDALAYGQMVSLAFKAIQEQQAMIDELKAKVAALEAA